MNYVLRLPVNVICLRGDIQNIDIEDTYIENVFKKVSSISELTITGGEPSIVPEKILSIVNLAKKHNVYIGSFYIATNAMEVNENFLMAVLKLYVYCDYKEGCSLQYSNDQFHNEIDNNNIELLKGLSFVSAKNHEDYPLKVEQLLNQGRTFYGWGAYKEVSIHKKDIEENRIEGMIYLNAIGNIIPECDLSYDSQDMECLIICSVKDKFNLINSVKKYNERIEQVKEESLKTNLVYSDIEEMA